MLERGYSHRSREDLIALRDELAGLSLEAKGQLFILSFSLGLMVKPRPLKILVWFVRLRHGRLKGPWLLACAFGKKLPKETSFFWMKLMQHMVDGQSLIDRTAAGAWSHRELHEFLSLARAAANNTVAPLSFENR